MTTSTCSASSRFHDDLPGPAAVSGSDDPPAFLYVGPEARCVLEHLSEVELCELSIDHALEDVGRELDLPVPPSRPPHPGLVLSPEATGQNVGYQAGCGHIAAAGSPAAPFYVRDVRVGDLPIAPL